MQQQPPVGPDSKPTESVTASDRFMLNATLGSNRWWRWVLGVLGIIVIWQGIGSIPSVVACQYLQRTNAVLFTCDDFGITGDSLVPGFVLTFYGFIVGIIGVWLVVKLLHKKDLTHVITGRAAFDYNRVLYAIWIGLSIHALLFVFSIVIFQEEMAFQAPNLWEYVTFLLFAIVLIPYQAGFEEVFFRGYLLQGSALLTTNRTVIALASGVIFAIPHLANPEPWAYGPFPYFLSLVITGTFYAFLTLLDGGIELAVGHHALNNLFISLVASTEVSVLQSPALFIVPVQEYRLFDDIIVQLAIYAAPLAVFSWKYGWLDYSKLKSWISG